MNDGNYDKMLNDLRRLLERITGLPEGMFSGFHSNCRCERNNILTDSYLTEEE